MNKACEALIRKLNSNYFTKQITDSESFHTRFVIFIVH